MIRSTSSFTIASSLIRRMLAHPRTMMCGAGASLLIAGAAAFAALADGQPTSAPKPAAVKGESEFIELPDAPRRKPVLAGVPTPAISAPAVALSEINDVPANSVPRPAARVVEISSTTQAAARMLAFPERDQPARFVAAWIPVDLLINEDAWSVLGLQAPLEQFVVVIPAEAPSPAPTTAQVEPTPKAQPEPHPIEVAAAVPTHVAEPTHAAAMTPMSIEAEPEPTPVVSAPIPMPAVVLTESETPPLAACQSTLTYDMLKEPAPAPIVESAVAELAPVEAPIMQPMPVTTRPVVAAQAATSPAASTPSPVSIAAAQPKTQPAAPAPAVIAADTRPSPPTAAVSPASPSSFAAHAIIPPALLAATVLAAFATLALTLLLSRTTNDSGESRRMFTFNARCSLAFGGVAVAIFGCAWFGATSLLALPGGEVNTLLSREITLALFAIAGGAACIGAGTALARIVSRSSGRALSQVRAIAAGDLDAAPINSTARNEFGELARAIDKLAAMVKDVVTECSISSTEVAQAADEIATGVQGMASSVGQVASQCAAAAGTCSDVGRLAADGGRTLQHTSSEFGRIDEIVRDGASAVAALGDHGRKISRIAEIINDISDRTHLVALNASIEAVKAGPNARPFAVFAEEVQRLAERAQKATEEVALTVHSIEDQTRAAAGRMSQGSIQIKHGVEMAGRARQDIEQLARTTGGVEGMIRTISAAAEEVGASAALSAGAAKQLTTRTADLKAILGRFRLDTDRFMRHAASAEE